MLKTLFQPLYALLPQDLRDLVEGMRATLSFIVGDLGASENLVETALVMGPKLLRLAQPILQQALSDPESTVALLGRLQPLLTRLLDALGKAELDEVRLNQGLQLVSEHIVDVLLRSDSANLDEAAERFARIELALRRGAESLLDLYLGS